MLLFLTSIKKVKKIKNHHLLFWCAIFTVILFTVYVLVYWVPLPNNQYQYISVFLVIEIEIPNAIFEVYKVQMRCQNEINLYARPFCNFPAISNTKIRFDYTNSTMTGKKTLKNFLLSSVGPGLSLQTTKQMKYYLHTSMWKHSFLPLSLIIILPLYTLLLYTNIIIIYINIIKKKKKKGFTLKKQNRPLCFLELGDFWKELITYL